MSMQTSSSTFSPPIRALIVVDMSVEQVAGIEYNLKSLLSNCRILCENASHFFDLVLDSRLWLRSKEESSLAWVWPETCETLFVADSEGASLIPDLRHYKMQFVEKNNYSCFANSQLRSILDKANVTEVYICGINTDYCVFATCLDSFQHNFPTFVVQDAVSSIGGKSAHEEGLRNLTKHFGDQALVETKDCCQNQPSLPRLKRSTTNHRNNTNGTSEGGSGANGIAGAGATAAAEPATGGGQNSAFVTASNSTQSLSTSWVNQLDNFLFASKPTQNPPNATDQPNPLKTSFGFVHPVAGTTDEERKQSILNLQQSQLDHMLACLPSYFFPPDKDGEIQTTLPIWSIDYINGGYPSVATMRATVLTFDSAAWDDMMQGKVQVLNQLVGKQNARQRTHRYLNNWKQATHAKLIACCSDAEAIGSLNYSLPHVAQGQYPILWHEQTCMRNSFWLTKSQFYSDKTYLDLFGIATALVVHAHNEGAKRSALVEVSNVSKIPWSEICKRYYQGLFVTICFVFEHGPYVTGKPLTKTMQDLHIRKNHYWMHFVPALLAFCLRLFEPGLFSPFDAWHIDTIHAFFKRERAKVSNNGIYSLAGYMQFMNSYKQKDRVGLKFLCGGYYPFLRILQCLHVRGNSLYIHPDTDQFCITRKERTTLLLKENLSVPWGHKIQAVAALHANSRVEDGEQPPKRRRISQTQMQMLSVKLYP